MKKISYIIDFEKIKHNIFMKNFIKCILFLLLLINYKGFAQCDSNNFTVTPTQGICNSKITVTAPNCDTWNAVLYRKNSNNIYEEADKKIITAGKAEFLSLTNGDYQVTIRKTDGTNESTTPKQQTLAHTYREYLPKITSTPPTSYCGVDGKVIVTLKNTENGESRGYGPYIVQLYEEGNLTTPVYTSASTPKSTGANTVITLQGTAAMPIKRATKYYVYIDDRVQGMCPFAYDKTIFSVTIGDVQVGNSFVRGEPNLEVCRPLKTGVHNGIITAEIKSDIGTGPYQAFVYEGATLIAQTPSIPETTGTTKITVEGSVAHKFRANKDYKLVIKDLGSNCEYVKNLSKKYTYFPGGTILEPNGGFAPIITIKKPKCSNCNEFEVWAHLRYNSNSIRMEEEFFPGLMTITIKRGSQTFVKKIETKDRLPIVKLPDNTFKTGDNFALHNDWVRHWYYEVKNEGGDMGAFDTFKAGDEISITYEDCERTITQSFNPIRNDHFTTHFFNSNGEYPTQGTCAGKKARIATRYYNYGYGNRSLANGYDHDLYLGFCENKIVQRIWREVSPNNWVLETNPNTGRKYEEKSFPWLNTTTGEWNTLYSWGLSPGKYKVEVYTLGNTNTSSPDYDPINSFGRNINVNPAKNIKDCKYYLSEIIDLTQDTDLKNISIDSYRASTFEGRVTLNFYRHQVLPFRFSASNPLKVKIEPASGSTVPNPDIFTATLPGSLATQYKITFPYTFEWYPEKDGNNSFVIADLLPGKYLITLSDNCSSYQREYNHKAYDVKYNYFNVTATTNCVNQGSATASSTGTINLEYSTYYAYTLNSYYLFEDTDPTNPTKPLKDRIGRQISRKAFHNKYGTETRPIVYDGIFENVPFGNYIVGVSPDYLAKNHYTAVDYDPNSTYATYSGIDANGKPKFEDKTERRVKHTFAFVPVKIEKYTPIDLDISTTLCDPTNDRTGNVVFGIREGQNTRYPIVYQLFVGDMQASGEITNLQQAKHSDGSLVQPIQLNTPPALANVYQSWNNIPRVNYAAGKRYIIKFSSGCISEQNFPISDFSAEDIVPTILPSNACYNEEVVLRIPLPESAFNIEWKSNQMDLLNGVDVHKKEIRVKATKNADFWVEYTAKSCPSSIAKSTIKLTLNVKPFSAQITTLTLLYTPLLPELLNGECETSVSWLHPKVEDLTGCGYDLSWSVLGASVKSSSSATSEGSVSWNGFKEGENILRYELRDKQGVLKETKDYKLEVRRGTTQVAIDGSFVNGSTSGASVVSQVDIGGTIYYRVGVQNLGNVGLRDVVLEIDLPSSTAVELPSPGNILLGDYIYNGVSPTVSYDGVVATKLIISGIDAEVFKNGGVASQRKYVYIPLKVKGSITCSKLRELCEGSLVSKATLIYSSGLGRCSLQNQRKEVLPSVATISTGLSCVRQELLCQGTKLILKAQGQGYTGYQWYQLTSLQGGTRTALAGETNSSLEITGNGVGYYEVEKTGLCSGATVTVSELIMVGLSANFEGANDVIRTLANGVGSNCSTTQSDWVSHFYLCNGESKELTVSFLDAQEIKWQERNSSCVFAQEDCVTKSDGCWTDLDKNIRTYRIHKGGDYRLRIVGNGCTRDFYFKVFTSGLTGEIRDKKDHDNFGLGSFKLVMKSSGPLYHYEVIRKSDNKNITSSTRTESGKQVTYSYKSFAAGAGSIEELVSGLEVPTGLTEDTFIVRVNTKVTTSADRLTRSLSRDCGYETEVKILRKVDKKGLAKFKSWSLTECNEGIFTFEVENMTPDYKVLLYEKDGVRQKDAGGLAYSSNEESIDDTEFKTPTGVVTTGSKSTFEATFKLGIQGGRYVFLIRNTNKEHIKTAEVVVEQNGLYPTSITTGPIRLSCWDSRDGEIRAEFKSDVPNPRVSLERYDEGTGTWVSNGTNSSGVNYSGVFLGLGRGTYRVKITSSLNRRVCEEYSKEIEITAPDALLGYAGVLRDDHCTTNGLFEIGINNMSGGSGEYEYSSDGLTWDTNPIRYVDGGTVGNPMVKVYARDKKSPKCTLELQVQAVKDLPRPTLSPVLATDISYNCDGEGTFTITPQTPAGRSYRYEYQIVEKDGSGVVTSEGAREGKGQMSYTYTKSPRVGGLPYEVRVYYEDVNTHPENILYKDDFGIPQGKGCSLNVPLGGDYVLCSSSGNLSSGSYMVLKNFVGTGNYRSSGDASTGGNGGFLVAHSNATSKRIYERTIKNIVPGKALKLSIKYINLWSAGSGKGNVRLKVSMALTGGTISEEHILSGAVLSGGWQGEELTFALSGNTNLTEGVLRLSVEDTEGAIGIDELVLSQTSEVCRKPVSVPVTIKSDEGFNGTIVKVQDAKCVGGAGEVEIELTNVQATSVITYKINKGAEQTPLSRTGNRIRISVPIGEDIEISIIKRDGTRECSKDIAKKVTILDAKPLRIKGVSTSLLGCIASNSTSTASVEIENGVGPYTLTYKKVGGTSQTSTSATANARITGLLEGEYEISVTDANGCVGEAYPNFTIKPKVAVTATVSYTKCATTEGTSTIQIEVRTGTGPYAFSKDGGLNYQEADENNPTYFEYTNLSSGEYSIWVKDALGCEYKEQVQISTPLTLLKSSDDKYSCQANAQEVVSLRAKGGVQAVFGTVSASDYQWYWTRGGSPENPMSDTDGGNVVFGTPTVVGDEVQVDVTIKTAGTYEFVLKDARNCRVSVTEPVENIVPEWDALKTLSGSQIVCAGDSSGVIGVYDALQGYLPIEEAIDRRKGVPPFTIEVFTKDVLTGVIGTTPMGQRNLPKGLYVVQIRDSKGCVSSQREVEIKEIGASGVSLIRAVNESCTTGGTLYGRIETQVTISIDNPRQNYTLGLYQNGALARNQMTNQPQLINGISSGNQVFPEVGEGIYEVVLIDGNGCRKTISNIEIRGTDLELDADTASVCTAPTSGVSVYAYTTGGTHLVASDYEFAVYQDGVVPTYVAAQGTLVTRVVNGVSYNMVASQPIIGLKVGAKYKISVRNRTNGCLVTKEIIPLKPQTTLASKIDETPYECNGGSISQSRLKISLTNIPVGTTQIDYHIYDYPMGNPVGAARHTGVLTVTGTTGTIDITPTLTEGRYIVVFKEVGGTACESSSEVFGVTKSPNALIMESSVVTKNITCNAGAEVNAVISGGMAPYRYKVSATLPTLTDWNAVAPTPNREYQIQTGITVAGTYNIYVKDAYGCVVSSPVQLIADASPAIANATVESLCAEEGQYSLRVTMGSLGKGTKLRYRIQTGTTTSELTNVDKVDEVNKVLTIRGLYSNSQVRNLQIVDENGCASALYPFTIKGKVGFKVEQTKGLDCTVSPSARYEIKNLTNTVTGEMYYYRVVEELISSSFDASGNEIQTIVDRGETIGQQILPVTGTVFHISNVGRYRVEVYDLANKECAQIQRIEVLPSVKPTLVEELSLRTNEICYNVSQAVGHQEGGSATIKASFSLAPYQFSILSAKRLSDGTAIAIPTGYVGGAGTTTNEMEVNAEGTEVRFKRLLGDEGGIQYTIEAKGKNDCTATTTVTIYAPAQIKLEGQPLVTQFSCSSDELQNARIVIPQAKVSGGNGDYTYSLYQGTTLLVEKSKEPEFVITDKQGGTNYVVKIYDSRGCESLDIAVPTIEPYITITSITTQQDEEIDCKDTAPNDKDEKMTVSIQTNPAVSTQSFTYEVARVGGGYTERATTTLLSHQFTKLVPGIYQVTVTNASGCSYYSNYQVKDPNTFEIVATEAKPVSCYGDTQGSEILLTFTDTDLSNGDQSLGGFDYEIRDINDATNVIRGTSTGNTERISNVFKAGTYEVYAVSTVKGCKTSRPALFHIRQADAPLEGSMQMLRDATCSNDTGEILVDVIGGVTPYTLILKKNGLEEQRVQDVYGKYLFTGLSGGAATGTTANYTLEVIDAWGCNKIDVKNQNNIDLTHSAGIQLSQITTEDVSCRDKSDGRIVIGSTTGGAGGANGNTTYFYELDGPGGLRPMQTEPDFKNLTDGTYTVYVIDRWGCKAQEQIRIGAPVPIVITLVNNSPKMCANETGYVSVRVSGGKLIDDPATTEIEGYTIELVELQTGITIKSATDILNNGYIQPSQDVLIEGVKPQVTYVVRAIDSKGCIGESGHIKLESMPSLSTSKVEYVDMCSDNVYQGHLEVTFKDSNIDWNKVKYSLVKVGQTPIASDIKSFDLSKISGLKGVIDRGDLQPSLDPQELTIYYQDSGKTCKEKVSDVVIIPIVEALDIILDPSEKPLLNELRVRAKNGVPGHTYYFNGEYYGQERSYIVKKNDPEGVDPSDSKLKKVITVRTEDSKGCSIEKKFYVKYIDIEIPNFFTPNGDGSNDVWAPENLDYYPKMKVSIFDRYGRLVKELEKGASWDGQYEGRELPAGDYWYILSLNSEEDDRVFYGHFTLYR